MDGGWSELLWREPGGWLKGFGGGRWVSGGFLRNIIFIVETEDAQASLLDDIGRGCNLFTFLRMLNMQPK